MLLPAAIAGRFPALPQEIYLRRLANGLPREDQALPVGQRMQVAVRAQVRDLTQIPANCFYREDWLFSAGAAGEVDSLRIRRPGQILDPAVEAGKQFANLLILAVVEHEAEAVALISRARLRTEGDVLAIGRIARCEIAAWAGRDADGPGVGIAQAQRENVAVGAESGDRIRVPFEGDLLAVRREGIGIGFA